MTERESSEGRSRNHQIVNRLSRKELLLVVVMAVVAVTVFLADASVHGALNIPRDDDWSYLKTAFTFYRTGVIDLNGWAYTTLIGQVLLAWPLIAIFGESILALQLMVAVFGIVGIVLLYVLLRRIASVRISALALITLVVGPIFGTVSTNFMTDMPVFTLQLATLMLGVVALERKQPVPWLAGASLAGIAAFSIRQSGIVALVAVYVMFAVRWRLGGRSFVPLVAWAAGIAAVVLPIYVYRQSLPNGVYTALDFPPFPRPGLDDRLVTLARSLTTVSLMAAPAFLLISPPAVVRSAWRRSRTTTMLALAVAAFVVVLAGTSLLGNHVHPFGDTWMAAGPGARLLPLTVFRVLVATAAATFVVATLLLLLGIGHMRDLVRKSSWHSVTDTAVSGYPTPTLLFGFAIATFLVNALATLALGAPFIDRYLIVAVPFAVVGIVGLARRLGVSTRRSKSAVVVVGTIVWATFGLLVVDFAATVDGAKWDFGRQAVMAGVSAPNLDAGVEWFGFHQTTESSSLSDIPGRTWWTTRFPDQPVCATVEIADESTASASQGLQQRYRSLFGHSIVLSLVPGPDSCPDSL